MQFLLDTNMLSDLARHPEGLVAHRVAHVGVAQVRTSIIVASELRFGLAKGVRRRLAEQVEALLRTIAVAPFEEPADVVYGDIRARLARAGQPIGSNDMFIAAHAIALGCTLVTANLREFSRVEGLVCENWLA